MSSNYRIFGIVVVFVGLFLPKMVAGERYRVEELSPPAGTSNENYARAINNAAEVVGRSGDDRSNPGGFIWSKNRGAKKVSVLTGLNYSSNSQINENRQIVGSYNDDDTLRPFLRNRNGTTYDLGVLPGDTGGEALGLNNLGNVVGYSSGPKGQTALLWTSNGGVQNLGKLLGGTSSKAVAINDSGRIVGSSESVKGKRAFLWERGSKMRDLGVLPKDSSSEATAISQNGVVVGTSIRPLGTRAFSWTPEKGMVNLGGLPGGKYGRPVSINSRGQIVGISDGPLGGRAVLWTPKGCIDLNTILAKGTHAVLTMATGINERGQIVALGYSTACQCGLSGHICHCGNNAQVSATAGTTCACPAEEPLVISAHAGHDNPLVAYLLTVEGDGK